MYVILLIVKFGIIASIDAYTLSPLEPLEPLARQQSCSLDIYTDLGSPQPLYLYHDQPELVETSKGMVHLKAHEKIDLYCTDGFRPPISGAQRKFLIATCKSGKQFDINGKSEVLRNVNCKHDVFSDTKITNRTCAAGNKTIEIGFSVQDAWFPLMEICHDYELASTLWTHHRFTPESQHYQRGTGRVTFLKGKFYRGINPNNSYKKQYQRKRIGELLGSQKIADDIISMNSDLFLARGHLAAKTDFMYASQQVATFYYINAAPQWQTFNNGNWLQVEAAVKQYAKKRNIDVDVYTGTYDVMTHPDVNGKETELYLAWNEMIGKQQIPVPRFYYKVLIADEIQAGIVFIGVNNPYLTAKLIKSEYILCPDVADQVDYVNWQRKNITLGYSYACSISEFTKVVKHLPHIPKYTKLLI